MKKNKYILIIISIILSLFSIVGLLFRHSAKEKYNLLIEIEKENKEQNVLINDILINNNNYLTKQILEYDKDEKKFNFNDEKIEYNLTKNDNYFIDIDKNNVKNVKVLYNNKEVKLIDNDQSYTFQFEPNQYKILSSEIKNTNILYIVILLIAFTISYLFIIDYLIDKVTKLYNTKIKIYEIIISSICLFILFYFNFYSIISILNWFSIILIFGLITYIIYKNRKNKNFNLESNFLLMSILLGITMLFLIPPFNVLDEDNHYIKAYDHLFYIEKDKAIGNFVQISSNVYNFRGKYMNNKFVINQKINVLSYYEELNTPINYKVLNEKRVGYGTHYAKILAYVPANLVNFVCKRLNANVLLTFLLSRFVNFTLALLLCYQALKIMPKFKPLLFTIMTFAVTYQSIVGINQDWINTSTSFLMIAYILYLVYKKEFVEKKDYAILIILSFMLAFAKTVYTPLILFVLLIDNKKFKHYIKHPIINKLLLIGIACSLTLLSYFWITIFQLEPRSNVPTNYYTLSGLLAEPIKFITIYFNTLRLRLREDFFRGYVDGFGWYTIWHNKIVLIGILLTYVGIICSYPKEKTKNELPLKLLSLFIFGSMYLIITMAFLIGMTINGSPTIDGLQPRYFIPIIFCLYLVLNNKLFKTDKIKNYTTYLFYTIMILNFLSFLTITCSLF